MMQDYERIRLFNSAFLEKFSVVHPSIPALIYIPVLCYFLVHIETTIVSISAIFLGLISWTFVEYSIHRFIFHLPFNGPWAKKLKYIIHGIHHHDPKDPLRLVAPPVMSILIGLGFLFLFSSILSAKIFHGFMFGFTLGYLCYDYLHWIVHHSKSPNKFVYYLRRNHAIHHHKQLQRFGVTSPFWDFVFHTYRVSK